MPTVGGGAAKMAGLGPKTAQNGLQLAVFAPKQPPMAGACRPMASFVLFVLGGHAKLVPFVAMGPTGAAGGPRPTACWASAAAPPPPQCIHATQCTPSHHSNMRTLQHITVYHPPVNLNCTPQAHWGQMGTMPGPHRALKPQQLAKKCKKRHFWPFPALSGPSHLDCFCTIVAGALPHNLGLVHCTPPWPKVCAKCFRTPQNSGESAKMSFFALFPLFFPFF